MKGMAKAFIVEEHPIPTLQEARAMVALAQAKADEQLRTTLDEELERWLFGSEEEEAAEAEKEEEEAPIIREAPSLRKHVGAFDKGCHKAQITAMTRAALAKAIAKEQKISKTLAHKIISSIAEIGRKEVTSTGIFVLPGIVMVKREEKPATKACKKCIFGKMCDVKARPASTIVKPFPVSALKKSV